MLTITPDPKHPRGGFAKLKIDGPGAGAGAAPLPQVLSIYNIYQQKWLGPKGWQADKVDLTPRSAQQEGETLTLILGPDIVNQLEEDTPIRIHLGAQTWDSYWPDTINAGPDEAVVGEIGGKGLAPALKQPTRVQSAQPDTPEAPAEGPNETPTDPEPSAGDDTAETPAPKSRLGVILGGLLLLAILAAGLFFGLGARNPETAAPTPAPAPAPAPTPAPDVVQNDRCSLDALSAEPGAFGALADRIRDCGGAVSADNALRLVEQATATNDPAALALFGALYDGTVTDDAIETTIGLTFADNPAQAADYYARAVAAGSTEAAPRLQAICRRLLLKSDTLARSARDAHCP